MGRTAAAVASFDKGTILLTIIRRHANVSVGMLWAILSISLKRESCLLGCVGSVPSRESSPVSQQPPAAS